MKSIKVIYYLLKLKWNLFWNSVKRIKTWINVISLIFVLILLFNSIQSSSFIVETFRTQFPTDNKYFNSLFNVILFFVFISNIFAAFFFGNLSNSLTSISTLARYPISLNKIVFYHIITGFGEIFNILFIPIYIAAYFVAGNKFFSTNFLFFIILLLFLIFFINNVFQILRNIASFLVSFNKFQWIIPPFIVIFIIITVELFPRLPSFLLTKDNIIRFSDFLTIFPSSVFFDFIKNTAIRFSLSNFVLNLAYFVIINYLILIINIYFTKKLYSINYGKISSQMWRNKRFLFNFISIININPIIKKNIIYFLRSPKMLVNIIFLLVGCLSIVIPVLLRKSNYNEFSEILISLKIMFLSFQTIIILILGGNIFGQEYNGIINYFIRPILPQNILTAKMIIPFILAIFNLFFSTIVLIFLNEKLVDYLLYISILFSSSMIFIFIGTFLSIHFPKSIPYYQINGLNTSLVTMFLSFLLLLLFAGIQIVLFSITDYLTKSIIIITLFIVGIIIIYYAKKILFKLSKILIYQKEKIILLCNQLY